jgi:hypothetical protein
LAIKRRVEPQAGLLQTEEQSACNQHALSMHSACHQHAISMHSACHQQAPPSDGRACRNRRPSCT